MLRLLHAADLHLDSPFHSLDAGLAAARRAEQRELPGSIVSAAKQAQADIILLSGDLLDSGSAFLETGERLCAALATAGMPVFIAPGNHDWYGRRSPWARLSLPANVHIFKNESLECVPLPELGVRVWGAGYTGDSCPPLLEGFEAAKDGDTLDVLVLHGDMSSRDSKYCAVTEAQLAASGMDYAALGHIHAYSGLRKAGDCYYAWPGCPEGRGFDECGEKGVIIAELSVGHCEARFVPLGGRRYELISVPVPGDTDISGAIRRALPEGASRHVLRVTLTGERTEPPDIPALERELAGSVFRLELRDGTTISRDIWEKAGEDTLRGLFLTKLRRRFDTAKADDRRLAAEAARYGLRALNNEDFV